MIDSTNWPVLFFIAGGKHAIRIFKAFSACCSLHMIGANWKGSCLGTELILIFLSG